MNLMIAIFNSIGAILLILFFRNRPPHPASNSDVSNILVYKEYSERHNNEVYYQDDYDGTINNRLNVFRDL